MEADDKHHDANQEGDQIPAHDTGQRQNAPDHRQHDAEPKQGTVAKWAKPITDWPVRGFRWLLHMLKTAEGLITALATVGIFIVAWLQWETFEKTDRTLNQTMVNGQRAYLSVQNAGIDPQTNMVVVKAINRGQTPARETDIWFGWAEGDDPCGRVDHRRGFDYVHDRGPFRFDHKRAFSRDDPDTAHVAPTQDWGSTVSNTRAAGKTLCVYGVVNYLTVFNSTRQTTHFCFWHRPSGENVLCRARNDHD